VCVIVVQLLQGKNPFAVQLNNNNKKIKNSIACLDICHRLARKKTEVSETMAWHATTNGEYEVEGM
jgi:hypothetical protein